MSIEVTIKSKDGSIQPYKRTIKGEGVIDTADEAAAAIAQVPKGKKPDKFNFEAEGKVYTYENLLKLLKGRSPSKAKASKQPLDPEAELILGLLKFLNAYNKDALDGAAERLRLLGTPKCSKNVSSIPLQVDHAVQSLNVAMGIKARVRASDIPSYIESSDQFGILYNPAYLALIRCYGGFAAITGELAHEMGHVLLKHNDISATEQRQLTKSQRHQMELDADELSGCALAKLRLPIRDFVKITVLLGRDESDSHPAGTKRKRAIEAGFARCSQPMPRPVGCKLIAF